jgi:hypothetical protein
MSGMVLGQSAAAVAERELGSQLHSQLRCYHRIQKSIDRARIGARARAELSLAFKRKV